MGGTTVTREQPLTEPVGDRRPVTNATGRLSSDGSPRPTTPWTVDRDGRGSARSTSIVGDCPEFGRGVRLAPENHLTVARDLLQAVAGVVGPELVEALLHGDQSTEAGLAAQRARVARLKDRLAAAMDGDSPLIPRYLSLLSLADGLVRERLAGAAGGRHRPRSRDGLVCVARNRSCPSSSPTSTLAGHRDGRSSTR
jgi:pyruvate-ferredoxin/flavodoxin oxidoreductase